MSSLLLLFLTQILDVKLTEEHVLANLDAEINLKSVDKKMIERMEKKIQK